MGAQGAGAGRDGVDLAVSGKDLSKLADDLDDMRDHLTKQVKRMDAIVDSIEAGRRRRRTGSSTGRRPRTPCASVR